MKKIVIYETTYGSTESYAKRISDRINAEFKKYNQVSIEDLADYDVIIIGTCLLGGKIYGTEKIDQWIDVYPDKHWALFTVGLANPELTDFQPIFESHFNAHTLEHLTTFHFRGTIRYKRLNLMHDLLNEAHLNRQSSIDMVPLDEENIKLLSTYGTTVDARDVDSIKPLLQWVDAQDNTTN